MCSRQLSPKLFCLFTKFTFIVMVSCALVSILCCSLFYHIFFLFHVYRLLMYATFSVWWSGCKSFCRLFYWRLFCFQTIGPLDCLPPFALAPVNPRPAGTPGFPRPAGGGGCLNTPPLLTRLLGHVAIRDRRRSKECQKWGRNHFGHFFGQVKGQVTRGH